MNALILVLLVSTSHAYDREDYPHWIDLDNDGQNTREKVLIRDSHIPVTFWQDGKVEAGLWVCPYTGRVTRRPKDLDVVSVYAT